MPLNKVLVTDIAKLRKICIEAYSKSFYNHWNDGGLEWYLDNQFSVKRLSSDLLDNNIAYYFIEHCLKTVGFIKISDNTFNNIPIEKGIELEKIYVLPKFKGLGIGKSAIKDLIKIATDQDKKNLFLSVLDTNTDAIAFYKKLGFTFHSKTILDVPYFKEELKGMHRLILALH